MICEYKIVLERPFGDLVKVIMVLIDGMLCGLDVTQKVG